MDRITVKQLENPPQKTLWILATLQETYFLAG